MSAETRDSLLCSAHTHAHPPTLRARTLYFAARIQKHIQAEVHRGAADLSATWPLTSVAQSQGRQQLTAKVQSCRPHLRQSRKLAANFAGQRKKNKSAHSAPRSNVLWRPWPPVPKRRTGASGLQNAARDARRQSDSQWGRDRVCFEGMAIRSLWQSIRALFSRAAASGTQSDASSGDEIVAPDPSNSDDLPVSFGYKTAWIAVPSQDGRALAEALGLQGIERCSWRSGIEKAYHLRGVFVTPPILQWTIAVGAVPEVGQDQFLPCMQSISRRFHQAFYFATHRIVEYQAWAIAEDGAIRRAFAWLGERGQFLLNKGERTPEELQLDIGVEAWECRPDEETVLDLASRWVLDPRELEQHAGARGPGWFGSH